MAFTERIANRTKSLCGYCNNHVYCYGYYDSFKRVPKGWERDSKPVRFYAICICPIRDNGLSNARIDYQ